MDSRKLVIGFLILAAITGFVSLSLLKIQSFSSANSEERNSVGASAGTPTRTYSNAFVAEPIPQKNTDTQEEAVAEDDSSLPELTPSSNLTQNLAQHLALEVVKANPNGPQNLGSEISINNLDEITFDKTALLSVDDLGLNDPFPKEQIKTKKDSTPEAILGYIEEVNRVLGETTGSEKYKSLVNQEAGPEMVLAAQLVLSQAINRIAQIESPQNISGLHAELLTGLENKRRIFESVSEYEVDPLRATLTLQVGEQVISRDLQNFFEEFSKLDTMTLGRVEERNESDLFLSVGNLFKVLIAEAQLFVPTDCVGPSCLSFHATESSATTGNLLQRIFEWGKKILTEQLKDRLVHSMVQQTINWIQGGGEPKFIQNWQAFLLDTADQAVGAVIEKEIPELCSSFGPLVKAALIPKTYTTGLNSRCTLTGVLNDLTRLYERFGQGDWVTYSNALRPYGNLWGSMIDTRDKVVKTAVAEQRAAELKALSSQGVTSQDPSSQSLKVCGNTQTHNTSEIWNYYAGPPSPNYSPLEADAIYVAKKLGEDYVKGTFNASSGNFQTCPKTAWRDGTPGTAVAQTLYTALDSPLQRIVNAQDLIGLVSALVDSALNRMIKAGADGLNKLFTDNEVNGSQPYTPGTYGLNNLCDGLTGAALTSCLQNSTAAYGIENGSTSTSPIDSCNGLTGQAFTTCVTNSGLGANATGTGQGPVNQPPTFVLFDGPSFVDLSGFYGLVPPRWDIQAVDPEQQTLTYRVDWGDGNTTTLPPAGSGVTVSSYHNYQCNAFVCNYVITVTVSDGFQGNEVTQTRNVTVAP